MSSDHQHRDHYSAQYAIRGTGVGRPPDPRMAYWARRFGLPIDRNHRLKLTQRFLDQLDACQSDCARRLLLGIGEQFEIEEVDHDRNQRMVSDLGYRAALGQLPLSLQP